MNLWDWLLGRLEDSLDSEGYDDLPEKPKRKNHDKAFRVDNERIVPLIDLEILRLRGYLVAIVDVPMLQVHFSDSEFAAASAVLYQGERAIVRRINHAGLYEAPDWDLEWVELVAVDNLWVIDKFGYNDARKSARIRFKYLTTLVPLQPIQYGAKVLG